MRNNYFGNARDELPDSDLNIDGFHPSPGHETHLRGDFFNENRSFNLGAYSSPKAKEGIESLFGNKSNLNERDNVFNDFEVSNKDPFAKEREEYNFLFNNEFDNNAFKKPIEKKSSLKSIKDTETASYTKESYNTYGKRESTKSYSVDTRSDCLSFGQKKFSADGLSYFQDLCPVKEPNMPDLNSLVSLSFEQGGSSLSVKLCTCELENCKLLHNFLDIIEETDLVDLQNILNETKAEVAKELFKLQSEAN